MSRIEKIVWGIPNFSISVLPLAHGQEAGFFSRAGLDVEVRYYHGGPELAAAFRAGEATIGAIGLPPFAKAFAEGVPARIVGSAIMQKLDHYLVARPGIESVADLGGARVGLLSPGSCDNYFIRHICAPSGLDPEKDLAVTYLGADYDHLSVFEDDRVDAAFFDQPFLAAGEARGLFRRLVRVGDLFPRFQWGCIAAHAEAIADRPQTVSTLLSAYGASARAIHGNPEGCVPLGARLFGMSPELFREALMRSLPWWELDARIDAEGLTVALGILKEMGAVPAGLTEAELICEM